MDDISRIKEEALTAIGLAADALALEEVRIKYLGREKGIITEELKNLKDLEIDVRRAAGPILQAVKKEVEEALKDKTASLTPSASLLVDHTAPGKKVWRGRPHILSREMEEMCRIFSSLNFSVAEGPEAESEWYNFDALNVAPNHPARDMWDTFWLKTSAADKKDPKKHMLLRTHTSPVQVRYMQKNNPPFAIVTPGRVFRYEATDATHEVNFHQLEGLMVGKNITFANFKFVIEEFFRRYFKTAMEFRYRPSFFPFTEPSVEIDIKWKGKWLEVAGAGMVNQAVFTAAGYNKRQWQGFAFGFGLDRLVMLKYKISDIRKMYDGDLRVVKQF